MDRTAIFVLMASLAAGCSSRPRVVVGSKNFTEQVVLGEILAQQIERRLTVPVERKLNLGGTLVAHEALVKGEIDLYPEYTGTALTAILKQTPAGSPAAGVWEQVRAAYRRRWRLEWLAPLGFNDTFAMVVRGETARRAHLASLSDAARTRKSRVLKPRVKRNASNGCRMRPCAWRIVRARAQSAPSCPKQSAPATTSEWPLRYLVAECITTSAPSAIGRVKIGVAQVESTARAAPAA